MSEAPRRSTLIGSSPAGRAAVTSVSASNIVRRPPPEVAAAVR